MVKFHRNILAFFGFVLFCLWERNQEQMLSHMECAGCCVYFTTTVDIFFNERRRKNWNENVVSSSPFEARFLRDLKRTCPSHTLYAAQFKQSSCYVSDFSSNLFDRCSRFICFREKRDEWNVCWTTKSSIFFWSQIPTVRVWFENCRKTDRKCSIWRIAMATDLVLSKVFPLITTRQCYHHPFFSIIFVCNLDRFFFFRFGQMTRDEDATACFFESLLFVLSCNVIKKGLFLLYIVSLCVASRHAEDDGTHSTLISCPSLCNYFIALFFTQT